MKQVQNLEFLIAFIYLACSIGFTGSACEIPCRFPAYGALCQSACNCTKDQCNHVSGCDGKWYFYYSSIDIHSCYSCYIFMNKNKFSGRLVVPWSEWYVVFVSHEDFWRIWRHHRFQWRHANLDLRSCSLNSEGSLGLTHLVRHGAHVFRSPWHSWRLSSTCQWNCNNLKYFVPGTQTSEMNALMN